MLAATLVIAVTTTWTLFYLIFYSISKRVQSILQTINLNFQYLAAYILAVVWLIADLSYRPDKVSESLNVLELFIYIILSMYIVVVILIQFGRPYTTIGFWITFSLFGTILLVDQIIYSSHVTNKEFFLPFLIVLALIVVANLFIFFNIPERYCLHSRIPQLFLTSHFWYMLSTLTLLLIFQRALYFMFKYNEEQQE